MLMVSSHSLISDSLPSQWYTSSALPRIFCRWSVCSNMKLFSLPEIFTANLLVRKRPMLVIALLAIKHLELIPDNVEIEQADRVAPEQRLDDGHVLLAVIVDVVALVLGLDVELA